MDAGRRYFAGRWSGAAHHKTIINRIMLRFRPIAPKPEAGGSVPGESPPENKTDHVTTGRPKRKYVRTKKNNRCKRKKVERENAGIDQTVLNQQASTEIAIRQDSSAGGSDLPGIHPVRQVPIWLNFDNKPENSVGIALRPTDQADLTALARPARAAESWVTVECVTDACMDGEGLGSTDMERMKNLEADTCPAFISDGVNRVQWVNMAYRKMVWAEEGGGAAAETAVWLVVKMELPVSYRAFACRVRVQYTCQKEKCSQTVPCDVWRMDFGGFAWRLDVKAALSLGR